MKGQAPLTDRGNIRHNVAHAIPQTDFRYFFELDVESICTLDLEVYRVSYYRSDL